LLAEIGWSLRFEPDAPRGAAAFMASVATVEPSWSAYLAA